MMKKKIISLILSITMIFGILASLASCGGGGDNDDDSSSNAERALVIMTENPDGLFNPFFSTSAADAKIVAMTQIGMLTYGTDADENVVVAFGDKESVAVKDFESKYDDASDTTTYTFVIKNDVKFSDGHPLTIEDVLFNLYVYLDPVYTGSSTMYSTDIVGLNDYRLQQHLNAGDNSDEELTAGARSRASARIKELINLFEKTAKTNSGNFDTTYEKMVAAIGAHNVSSGYKNAIATPSMQSGIDFNKQLLADY
jgi:ABC-type transport system substrate-binding protein